MSEEESKKRKAEEDTSSQELVPPVKKASTESSPVSLESVIKSVRLQMESETKNEPDDTEAQTEAENPVPVSAPVPVPADALGDSPKEPDTTVALEATATGAGADVVEDTAVADTAAEVDAPDPTTTTTDDEVKPSDDAPKDVPEVTATTTTTDPVPDPAAVNTPSLPPGVPMGVPMALPVPVPATTTNTNTSAPPTNNAPSSHAHAQEAPTLTEKEDIPVTFVGRIIGKGGEQIRDLQARSACKVDVDQNVPHGAPRVITYHGSRDKIDFAKNLVHLLCQENWKNVELPLGFASRAMLQVPGTVIGKIIGRGGEMIKELQSKSYAKIQVDHNSGGDTGYRTVTITGNELGVKRAEEMINLIIANPLADASSALDMLILEKSQGVSVWGSGPPYTTMPNNGQNMPSSNHNGGSGGYGGGGSGGGRQQSYNQQPGQYGGGGYAQQQQQPPYQQSYGGQQQARAEPTQAYGQYGAPAPATGGGAVAGGMESEVFYSSKMYMGRIIGQKGVTINDLQKRSGCDIQINQNVPMGQDCEVHIKGVRQGVDNAKQMLNEIIQMGPNHSYAGGRGGGSSGGSSGGGYGQQGGGGGYGQHQQQPSYGQPQAQYGQTQSPYQQQAYAVQQNPYAQQQQEQQAYGQQSQYAPQTQNPYGQPQQAQMQQQPQQYGAAAAQANYGAAYPYGQQAQAQAQPQAMYQQPPAAIAASPWKAATSPNGQVYYYNEKTNETTWDKPAGMP